MNRFFLCLFTGFVIWIPMNLCGQANNPPAISFVYPFDYDELEYDSVHLIVNATDPDEDIVSVRFEINDSVYATIAEEPYTFIWYGITDGFYEITALVEDDDGYNRKADLRLIYGDPLIWRPYKMEPMKIPGKIEAEWFDNGGQGVAYYESIPSDRKGCSGVVCRPDELMDIGATIDEAPEGQSYNYFLGWTYPGNEWLDYTVTVDSSANYVLKARIATGIDGRTFSLEKDGLAITDKLAATNTLEHNKNEWYNYKNMYFEGIYLEKGTYTIRLIIDAMNGPYGGLNINYLEFIYPEQNPPKVEFSYPAKINTLVEMGSELTLEVNATDSESDVERVEFYKHKQLLGTDTEAPFQYTFDNLSNEEFNVMAIAYDMDGNSAQTLNKHITVYTPVNIENRDIQQVKIYPNPVKDKLYFVNHKTVNTINIYTTEGQKVMNLNAFDGDAIDISTLQAGHYFIEIIQHDERFYHKMIKQ